MDTLYFKFNYVQYEDGQMTNQGTCYYYTQEGYQNTDKMKQFVKDNILKNPAAVVTLQNIVPIDRGIFTLESGQEPAI